MKFYEFKNDLWINLAQIVQVNIAREVTIRFADGTDLIEDDRRFIDPFLKAINGYKFASADFSA